MEGRKSALGDLGPVSTEKEEPEWDGTSDYVNDAPAAQPIVLAKQKPTFDEKSVTPGAHRSTRTLVPRASDESTI
eukprot:4894390-Heterocapsa_arctica.AAC.1